MVFLALVVEYFRDAIYYTGAGGWPTIRYFNKETGYGGGNYKKVTSGAMCDELGNEEHMQVSITHIR